MPIWSPVTPLRRWGAALARLPVRGAHMGSLGVTTRFATPAFNRVYLPDSEHMQALCVLAYREQSDARLFAKAQALVLKRVRYVILVSGCKIR
eukprot:6357781-Prymnesium_polylepis.2